jgi:phage tail-like protein
MLGQLQRVAVTARFLFEVDGLQIGLFREVTGLRADLEVITIEEGGQNEFVHQLPGRLRWPHVVLKRGITAEDNLFEWLRRFSGDGFARNGNRVAPSTGAITVLDEADRKLRSWEVVGAFPVRWEGPTLAATRTEVAEEELEIAHHGFRAKSA